MAQEVNQVHQGSILFYREKGWGFLRDRETSIDYFYHISNVINGFIPSSGDMVKFTLIPGKKGPIAAEIELIPK